MTRVLVIVPESALPADVAMPPGCRLESWLKPGDVARALAGDFEAAVLLADGLDDTDSVAEAVRHTGKPVVVVYAEQWDGFAPLPLAAVCKGVVSGFGVQGVWAAARAL